MSGLERNLLEDETMSDEKQMYLREEMEEQQRWGGGGGGEGDALWIDGMGSTLLHTMTSTLL